MDGARERQECIQNLIRKVGRPNGRILLKPIIS